MKNLIFRILLTVFLAFTLLGCATTFNPATGRKELILIGTGTEKSIGNTSASQIKEKYTLSEGGPDLDRLKRIGQRVAEASDRKDLDYQFYLIEDKDMNAFTIPGGHVYIFRGLYDQLNDDEIASVMGHEIGHVAARHIVKKLQASLGYQILSTIALVTFTKDSDDAKKTGAYIAYAASTSFNLVMLGYSREDEYEADELGVKYARASGFDPRGLITSFEKMKEKEKKGSSVTYMLRSHPYLDERIKRIESML
ncbi:MAG: M48 family metalloprotease [Candidatus Omnitrophota bacterium]